MRIAIFCLLLAVSYGTVRAAPIINEISPKGELEWVELYNPDTESADLAGWILKDGNQSTSDDILLSGVIEPGDYLVFTHEKGWLNDGGDTISLIATGSASADSVTYSAVGEGKTYARIPDDSENWSSDADPTQGAPNPAPLPSPSVVPSPESSPHQAPSPAPTPIETPAPSALPPSSRVRPSPQIHASPDISVSPAQISSVAGAATDSADIDVSAFARASSPVPSVRPAPSLNLNRDRARVVLLIGTGLLSTGGVSYLIYRRYRIGVRP